MKFMVQKTFIKSKSVCEINYIKKKLYKSHIGVAFVEEYMTHFFVPYISFPRAVFTSHRYQKFTVSWSAMSLTPFKQVPLSTLFFCDFIFQWLMQLWIIEHVYADNRL